MRAGMTIVLGAAAAAALALALAGLPAAAAAPGDGWGPEVRLATSVDSDEPALAAMSMDDDAVVGWTRLTTSGRSARVRLRTGPRGAWSAPVALGPGRLVALAMDSDGDALALRAAGGPARAARILRNGNVIASALPSAGTGRVLGATLRQDGKAAAYVLRPDGVTIRLFVQESPGGAWTKSVTDFTIPAPPVGPRPDRVGQPRRGRGRRLGRPGPARSSARRRATRSAASGSRSRPACRAPSPSARRSGGRPRSWATAPPPPSPGPCSAAPSRARPRRGLVHPHRPRSDGRGHAAADVRGGDRGRRVQAGDGDDRLDRPRARRRPLREPLRAGGRGLADRRPPRRRARAASRRAPSRSPRPARASAR